MLFGSLITLPLTVLLLWWLHRSRKRRGQTFKWWEWPVFFIAAQALFGLVAGFLIGLLLGTGS